MALQPLPGPADGPSDRPTDVDVAGVLGGRIRSPMSAVDRVAEVLREQIVEGALPPGLQLTEEALSSSMRVSRNTVREACALLTAERLVERVAHRGVFVASPDAGSVQDMYAVRLLVEPAALRSGPALTPELVARMRAEVTAAGQARAHGDWAAVSTANQHVHRLVVQAGGSRRVDAFFASVLAEMRLVFHRAGGEFHAPFVDRNEEIVTLLEEGRREEAADALVAYLEAARAELVAALQMADAD